ncbi:MAG: hypothetical protein ACKOQ1_05555, partial [Actinomycetota bacterium]
MSKTVFSRRSRPVALLAGLAVVLAACGGSGSTATSETRTRNAALEVSNVTIAAAIPVAISASGVHSFVLDERGNLYGFGENGDRRATPPALRDGGTKFTAVSSGASFSLALDDKGNLYGLGANYFGHLTAPAPRD